MLNLNSRIEIIHKLFNFKRVHEIALLSCFSLLRRLRNDVIARRYDEAIFALFVY